MIIIYLILMFTMLLNNGCNVTYEKIGNYKYEISTDKVFTGDYDGIVKMIKTYKLNNTFQAGVTLESKLGFEPRTDTIYSSGYTEIDTINKTLIVREYYYYGYKKFIKTDSIYKVFKQTPTGSLKLSTYTQFCNGVGKDIMP
ncbi:hypothetical protein QW060_07515 [Myroides ceti]|uniref:Lipoprotein n=1 Tax=Paenimyroides ceti TaxID=395087 RepID=A0ABT8CSN0_9FLAO|nr:hypothetical protein [Paenimyroides ceti]MDN3706981.1 hypothetical protein [Paenimyroides ceti]